MKFLLGLLGIVFLSCSGSQKSSISSPVTVFEEAARKEIHSTKFQFLLDSFDVIGSILIYDLKRNTFHSNDFDWANKGHLPASTFKIVNSIIGLETGFLESENSVFEWDGQDRWNSSWEKDLELRDAFQLSCVPCYQELARSVGVERMRSNILKLGYGNISIDSSSIDDFWLMGPSRISQFEQVSFLKRLYYSKLPISKRTNEIVKNIMIVESHDDYKLSCKTGLSNEDNHYNGWFVGYLEKDENVIFFATNIEPNDQERRFGFIEKREEITLKALIDYNK